LSPVFEANKWAIGVEDILLSSAVLFTGSKLFFAYFRQNGLKTLFLFLTWFEVRRP
jgi:hypothetical protein